MSEVAVAFMHARWETEFPDMMLASARRYMDCEFIQLTDEKIPALPGCTVHRLPWNDALMMWRFEHLAALGDRPLCVLDTDLIVQADLRPVFDHDFDVALTRRDGPILDPNGIDVAKLMPYNCGVMFCRNAQFWRDCLGLMEKMPDDLRKWYGDQMAVKAIAPYFRTLELECDEYNYTPLTSDENVSGRKVVHYKGNRKQWMLDKWQSQTTPL